MRVGDVAHGGDAVALGVAGRERRRHGGGGEAVEAVELGRAALLGHRHQLVEQHRLAAGRRHVEVAQVGGVVAALALDLADDLVLPAVEEEVAEPLLGERELERLADVARGDAEVARSRPVERDPQLGVGELQVDVDEGERRAARWPRP